MILWLDRNQPAVLSLVMLLILATMYATGFLSASPATLEIGPVAAGALRVPERRKERASNTRLLGDVPSLAVLLVRRLLVVSCHEFRDCR